MRTLDAETGYKRDTAPAQFQSARAEKDRPSPPMLNILKTTGVLLLGVFSGFFIQIAAPGYCPDAALVREIQAETLAMIRQEHARRFFEEQDRGVIIGPYRPGASGFD